MLLWLRRQKQLIRNTRLRLVACGNFVGLAEQQVADKVFNLIYATVAQLVEQLIRNQQVAGSSPASSSRKLYEISYGFF